MGSKRTRKQTSEIVEEVGGFEVWNYGAVANTVTDSATKNLQLNTETCEVLAEALLDKTPVDAKKPKGKTVGETMGESLLEAIICAGTQNNAGSTAKSNDPFAKYRKND